MEWPAWPTHGRVGIDLESCDPHIEKLGPGWRRGAYICGVSIAFDGVGGYLSAAHAGGGNVENPDRIWEYLRDQAKTFRGELCGHNLLYDVDGLATLHGVHFRNARLVDTVVAAKLADSKYHEAGPWGAPGYKLDQCLRRAGLPLKAEDGMLAAWRRHEAAHTKSGKLRSGWEKKLKSNMWRLHADDVEEYAVWDAEAPLKLVEIYKPLIPAAVWELETDVTSLLLDMRLRGMPIDESQLEETIRVLGAAADSAQSHLNELCAVPVSCMSPADLEPHLVRFHADDFKRTPTGLPSLPKLWLQERSANPLVAAILDARASAKLLSMVKSLPKFLVNGRLHPSLKQYGAQTGRMSCAEPNVQQSPKRAEAAKAFRRLFVGEDGARFFSADFSKQEPRWIAHWGAEAGFPDYAAAFRANPRLDPYKWVAERTNLDYNGTKTVMLGLGYGMGGAKLCRSLGLPTGGWRTIYTRDTYPTLAEAKAASTAARAAGQRPPDGWDGPIHWEASGPEGARIMKELDQGFPTLKATARACADSANRLGAVYDWMDRRIACRFGHKALNYISQGSAATHTKRVAVEVWRNVPEAPIHMLVHDEIVGSCEDESVARRVADIMEYPYSQHVPFVVDPAVGNNWSECK